MQPERKYKTESGTYAEFELGVVVWLNPEHGSKPQARLLATMTDHSSVHPMAFPMSLLRKNKPFDRCPTAEADTLQGLLLSSTPEIPVIVPVTVARNQLGWDEFFVPTKYDEKHSS